MLTRTSAATLQQLSFAHDPGGRITGIAATAGPATDGWTYGYDQIGRLLSATNTGNSAYSQTFTYDLAGNLLTNSAIGSYTYPAPGAAHPHAPLTAGPNSYTYDAP